MARSDLKIVFMGTPDFAVAPLQALYDAGYTIAAVVTVADKPAGRGRHLQQSAVKQWAVTHELPVLQPVKLRDEQFLGELASFGAHLFVVVAFRMLPAVVWQMPPLGTFNLHASLLPMYRGAAPINHAIINGEQVSGVTTFLLDEQLDTGRILFQEPMDIGPDETAGELHDRMMAVGSSLVVKTCDAMLEKTVIPQPQSSIPDGCLKEAPKIFKDDCRIDWSLPVEVIRNRIRGLSPYPAAFTDLISSDTNEQLTLKIFRARAADRPLKEPGSIETDGRTYLAFACADGWLMVDEVHLSGRKKMKTDDFLRGFNPAGGWLTDKFANR